MDNQHSTGSWNIKEMPWRYNFIIYQKETLIQLANVGDQLDNNHVVLPGTTILANAHLIAAAPDLLECLIKITTSKFWEKQFGGGAIDQQCTKAINKALNK